MRRAALAGVLGVVLAASALDLAAGLLWVVTLLGLIALRRRMPLAPLLVLLAASGVLVAGSRWGWLVPPAPVSYEAGWFSLGRRLPGPALSDDPGEAGRLAAAVRSLERLETGLSGTELERRAGAVLAFASQAAVLSPRAPREVALVQGTARRLAQTLASPEFRDLEGRRRRAGAYLAEVGRRVALARESADLVAIRRALDPATMAGVSLRAVREDLAAAREAMGALLRALGGDVPAVTARVTAWIDDAARTIRREVRYVVTVAAPTRLVRLEIGALRAAPVAWQDGAYGLDGGPLRPLLLAGPWVEAGGGRRVELVATRVETVEPARVWGPLRRIAFRRLDVEDVPAAGELPVTVGLPALGGLEVPLAVDVAGAPLGRLLVPRGALHLVSARGIVTEEGAWDAWTATDPREGPLTVELAPALPLLRSRPVAAARPYVYRPNPGAAAAGLGLAALTLLLAQRPRPGR